MLTLKALNERDNFYIFSYQIDMLDAFYRLGPSVDFRFMRADDDIRYYVHE